MEKVIRYKCDHCGELFYDEQTCIEHEEFHRRIHKANEMLKSGATLSEINNECHIWYSVPEYLKDVTKDNCFVIQHWQCCSKPAYQIVDIGVDSRLNVRGCGSWNGYYGYYIDIASDNLKNPRPKEELFIDPRY